MLLWKLEESLPSLLLQESVRSLPSHRRGDYAGESLLAIGIYWQRFIARIQTSHFFSWTCTRKAWRQTLWQKHIDDGGTADNLTGFLRDEGIEVGQGHEIEEITADLDRLVHRVRRREEAVRDDSEGESGEE